MSENIIAALMVYLRDNATIGDLVGARVFGVELPEAEAASMPRPCVVLKPSGGDSFAGRGTHRHETQRLDAFSYGETIFEAYKVSVAVYDALALLTRNRTGSTLIHWVNPAGGWTSNRDPDADWPMVFQSFQAFFALEAAA